MELSFLTFIVTDDCNFNCAYCFQRKEKKTITNTIIKTAVDFFYPFLKEQSTVDFYGGEPLLAFDKVKHTVMLVKEKNKQENKKIQFNLTTNGSLLTDEILDFFNTHHFGLLLSFDGLAQEKGRKKGTLEQMVQAVQRIQAHPHIDLEINSVFTPKTITTLTKSLRFMMDLGCSKIIFNISTMEEWQPADLEALEEELARLTDFLVSFYKKTGSIPITNFQAFIPGAKQGETGETKEKKRGIFRCYAGQDRMAVTPGGELWGCYLFHDYFKTRQDHPQYRDYFFGRLGDFIANYEDGYPEILANYSELRMDFFQSEQGYCFLCKDVEGCVACPVNAAYTSGELGKIPCRKCDLIKIQRKAQKNFRQKLSS